MALTTMAGSWTVGVYLATRVAMSWQGALLFLLAAALLALLLRGRGLTILLALALALLALGAFRAGSPSESRQPLPIQAYNGVERIQVEGVVSSDPQPRGNGWRFPLSVERIQVEPISKVPWDFGDEAAPPLGGGELPSQNGVLGRSLEGEWRDSRGELQVLAMPSPSLVAARKAPLFRYGDRLRLTGGVQEPPVLKEFDYADYLARQGIFSIMTYPDAELVGEGEGSWLMEGLYSVRHRLSRSLSLAVAEPQDSLAQALLLGRQSTMPPELTQAFRDTGASHLLAISGLNVGILLALSLGLSRWLLGAKRQLYLIAPLLAIWAYAGISGMSPSVERATIMGTIYLVGLYLGRQNSVMPALAAAAAVMVGMQPRILSDISFQLSFTAMAGLVLLAPPIERGLRAAFRGDETGDAGWTRSLSYAIAATVAATLATLPLVAFHFQQVSLVGLPATLLALPAMPAMLGTSLLTSLLGLVSAPAAEVAGWAAWLSLSYLKAVVELLDAIHGNTLKAGAVGAPLVVAYYGGLLALVAGRSRLVVALRLLRGPAEKAVGFMGRAGPWLHQGRTFWAIAALVLLATGTIWAAALSRPDGRLHVTVLDVGQGDAALIVTPGGRQVLIDGGPDPQRLLDLLGKRIPFWDHSLDLVLLTHPHEDHVAGLVWVLQRYEVALVVERDIDYPSPAYALWRSALVERDVPALQAVAGQRIELDGGLALEVLYPPDRLLEDTSSDVDNASVVVRLVYGKVSFLFPGDLHQEGESFMVYRSLPLASTVLKVAHHGSRSSTTLEFAEEVSPLVAVISLGEDNRFGHPHQETLDTLGELLPPDRILTTATNGSVELVSDGSRLWVKTER